MNIRICFMVLSLFGFRAFAVEPAQPNPHPAELVMKSYLEAELESASLFEFCARTRPLVVKVEDYPECPPHETSEIVRRNPLEVSCEAKHEEYRCTIRYTVVASGGIQAGGESAWIIRPEPRRLVTTKTFIMRKRDEWKISDPYAAPHVASDTLLKRLLLEKQAPSSTARIKAIDASITKLLDVLPSLKEGDSHSWKATPGLRQA